MPPGSEAGKRADAERASAPIPSAPRFDLLGHLTGLTPARFDPAQGKTRPNPAGSFADGFQFRRAKISTRLPSRVPMQMPSRPCRTRLTIAACRFTGRSATAGENVNALDQKPKSIPCSGKSARTACSVSFMPFDFRLTARPGPCTVDRRDTWDSAPPQAGGVFRCQNRQFQPGERGGWRRSWARPLAPLLVVVASARMMASARMVASTVASARMASTASMPAGKCGAGRKHQDKGNDAQDRHDTFSVFRRV